jgi:type II secretory pathway component PulC
MAFLMVLALLFGMQHVKLRKSSVPVLPPLSKNIETPTHWSDGITATSMAWGVFVASEGGGIESKSPVAPTSPYRLAGTFFNDDDHGRQTRQAVLDDTRKRDQRIVSEGDVWDDVRVESIYTDHVVLIRGGTREEIWLSLMTSSIDPTAAQGDGRVTNSATGAETAIATNRFGSQMSDYRWVFKRDALMDYAKSVTEDSVRMAQLFDSLKPIYDDRKRIQGYQLETQGENEFFRDVGLKENDQVQKVNGMSMSNRRRAEFFISEFTNNRMNVFVLDIERNGQNQKLIYQLQ